MSSIVCIVAVGAVLTSTTVSAAVNAWTTVAPMSAPRYGLAAATGADGRIYAIGGYNTGGFLNTVEAYTPGSNSWTTLAPMPTARYGLAAATGADGRIYAIGGDDGGFLNTVEVYTPSSNSWTTVAPMPTARSFLAAATGADGRIYAVGGLGNATSSTVEAYTPASNSWATVAALPAARGGLAAATGPDGRIYAIGGLDGTAHNTNTVEVYTPGSNSWATVTPMPTARYYLAAATGSDGRIYAIGGDGNPNILNKVEAYTPGSNSWATVAPMPTERYGLAAATGSDGRIYAIGGQSNGSLQNDTVEAFTTGSQATTATVPTSNSIALGQSNTDRATVTGDTNGSPSGTVAFAACGPLTGASGCISGGTVVGSPITLTPGANDTATATSPTFTPTGPGTWCFRANYSGDANYGASYDGSSAECFAVLPPPTVQDSNPSVAYDGWRGLTDPTASGGTYRASPTKGSTATFKFSGTGITWVTRKGPYQGIAAVTIDGVSKGTVDLYATTPQGFSQGYSGLASKSHTMVITLTGNKNPASGNISAAVDAFVVGLTTIQESSTRITYDTWKGARSTSASGGTYRVSPKAGATSNLSFTGTGVDWITETGPSAGMAQVTIDGVSKGTLDLYASSVNWQVVEAFSGLASGSHTIVVTVLGTKNAASAGTMIVVDAFAVHS